MWARWCELVIAAWLAVSPWFLGGGDAAARAVGAAAGVAVAAVAVACLRRPARPLHLVTLVLAAGLAGYGWVARGGQAPVHENHVLVGLVLAMFALVPNEASAPPRPWRTQLRG